MFSLKDDLNMYTSKNQKVWPDFLLYLDATNKKYGSRRYEREFYTVVKGEVCREKIGLSTIYYLKINNYVFNDRCGDLICKEFLFSLPQSSYIRSFRYETGLSVFFEDQKGEDESSLTVLPVKVWIKDSLRHGFKDRLLKTPQEKMERLILGNDSHFFNLIFYMDNSGLKSVAKVFWGIDLEMPGQNRYERNNDRVNALHVLSTLPRTTFGLTSVEEAGKFINALYKCVDDFLHTEESLSKICEYFKIKHYTSKDSDIS